MMSGTRFYRGSFDDRIEKGKAAEGFAGTEKDTNYVEYGNRWPKNKLCRIGRRTTFPSNLVVQMAAAAK